MQIPSHQIHNVLKVYGKQLSQARILDRKRAFSHPEPADKINLSAIGKRQSIIDKVAADIVDRITQSGPQDKVDQEIVTKLENELGQPIRFKEKKSAFVFNIINQNNEKTTSMLRTDDPDYLMRRLEELAKEAVDRNMEL
jgi:hypothetical protein